VRAISTAVAHFLHTEGVTGSNPVSPILGKNFSIFLAAIDWSAMDLPEGYGSKTDQKTQPNLAKTFKKT